MIVLTFLWSVIILPTHCKHRLWSFCPPWKCVRKFRRQRVHYPLVKRCLCRSGQRPCRFNDYFLSLPCCIKHRWWRRRNAKARATVRMISTARFSVHILLLHHYESDLAHISDRYILVIGMYLSEMRAKNIKKQRTSSICTKFAHFLVVSVRKFMVQKFLISYRFVFFIVFFFAIFW